MPQLLRAPRSASFEMAVPTALEQAQMQWREQKPKRGQVSRQRGLKGP